MAKAWRSKGKKARQATAKVNMAARSERSDEQQLQRLESEGHGHCVEAQKLRARILSKKGVV